MEYIPFKLYHGTSIFYLESIMEMGLGAINPLPKLKAYDWCKTVYELSKFYLKDQEKYSIWLWILKGMAEQTIEGDFNAQHGQTYLTNNQSKAIDYAINNKWGGEIISYSKVFYQGLTELEDVALKNEIKKLSVEFEEIFQIINKEYSPILMELNNVPVNSIRSEKGENPTETINSVLDIPNNLNDELGYAFRLIKPISPSGIKVFKINEDRSLSPLSIKYS